MTKTNTSDAKFIIYRANLSNIFKTNKLKIHTSAASHKHP